jgi:hypothetical protein
MSPLLAKKMRFSRFKFSAHNLEAAVPRDTKSVQHCQPLVAHLGAICTIARLLSLGPACENSRVLDWRLAAFRERIPPLPAVRLAIGARPAAESRFPRRGRFLVVKELMSLTSASFTADNLAVALQGDAGELPPCRPRVVHLDSARIRCPLVFRCSSSSPAENKPLARLRGNAAILRYCDAAAVHGRRRRLGAFHLVRLASRSGLGLRLS